MTLPLLTMLLLSCARHDSPPPPSYAPTHVAWADLHGTPPATPADLPDFAVVNHADQSRGPEDLRGKPTAVWFYPAANTPG